MNSIDAKTWVGIAAALTFVAGMIVGIKLYSVTSKPESSSLEKNQTTIVNTVAEFNTFASSC